MKQMNQIENLEKSLNKEKYTFALSALEKLQTPRKHNLHIANVSYSVDLFFLMTHMKTYNVRAIIQIQLYSA